MGSRVAALGKRTAYLCASSESSAGGDGAYAHSFAAHLASNSDQHCRPAVCPGSRKAPACAKLVRFEGLGRR